MLREIVFGAGLPYLLCVIVGLDGILWFMPLADVVTAIIGLAVTLKTNRKLKEMEISMKDDIEAGMQQSYMV